MSFIKIRDELRAFVEARDWNQFHSPKNLATAMMVEAGELNEIFQWLTTEESEKAALDEAQLTHIGEELSDVIVYCIRIADRLDIDLEAAIADKFKKNAAKYPVELSKGVSTKYDKLDKADE